MRRYRITILAAVMLAGCSTPVPVRVTDVQTGAPAAEILVERSRPASVWEKIINPIGKFYHPMTVVESYWTDAHGQCSFRKITDEDSYIFYTTNGNIHLKVLIGGQGFLLPSTTNWGFPSYYLSLEKEDGKWKTYGGHACWNWDRDKPTTFEPKQKKNE